MSYSRTSFIGCMVLGVLSNALADAPVQVFMDSVPSNYSIVTPETVTNNLKKIQEASNSAGSLTQSEVTVLSVPVHSDSVTTKNAISAVAVSAIPLPPAAPVENTPTSSPTLPPATTLPPSGTITLPPATGGTGATPVSPTTPVTLQPATGNSNPASPTTPVSVPPAGTSASPITTPVNSNSGGTAAPAATAAPEKTVYGTGNAAAEVEITIKFQPPLAGIMIGPIFNSNVVFPGNPVMFDLKSGANGMATAKIQLAHPEIKDQTISLMSIKGMIANQTDIGPVSAGQKVTITINFEHNVTHPAHVSPNAQ